MNKQPVYSVTIYLAAGPASFQQVFLFKPEPDDLILAIQAEIGRLERVEGDEEDAELIGTDIESLKNLCQVAASVQTLESRGNGTTIIKVTVAGTEVGSIHVYRYDALSK